MGHDALGRFQPSIWQRALAAVLTLVTSALGLAEWLVLRIFVQRFLILGDISPWAWNWWNSIAMVALGVVWLTLVYLSAHFYQTALEKRRLWRVFGVVSLAQVLVPVPLIAGLYLVACVVRTPS